jgi:bacterioferritin-associated ferredoxin
VIICVCRGVSDRAVAAAIEAGADGAEAVAAATGAGTDCGCCRDAIEALMSRRSPCRSTPCPGCPRAAAAAG